MPFTPITAARRVQSFLALVVAYATIFCIPIVALGQAPLQATSSVALEGQIADMANKLKALSDERTRLETARGAAKRAQETQTAIVEKARQALRDGVPRLKKTVDEIISLPDEARVSDESREGAAFREALSEAFSQFSSAAMIPLAPIDPTERDSRYPPWMFDRETPEGKMKQFFPNLDKLLRAIPVVFNGEPGIRAEDLRSIAKEASFELSENESEKGINGLSEQLQNQIEKRLADYLQKSSAAIDDLQKKIDEGEKKYRQMDEMLLKKEQQAAELEAKKKGQVNERLIWAVFAMIVVLGLGLFVFRFMPEGISAQLIKERTFVEVTSMGFVLVTIILLGTAERLAEQSVGTLLGTIAGYIFGRERRQNDAK